VTRPWQIWAAFVAALIAVVTAMGWASATVVRLDAAQGHAAREALLEENVRLALWRLESALTPIIVRESARPHFVYSPYYSIRRAFTRDFGRLDPGEAGAPSPLLQKAPPLVLLHFQFDGRGRLSSPQAPREAASGQTLFHNHLEQFARSVTRPALLARLNGVVSIELLAATALDAPPPERRSPKLRSKQEFQARAQNYLKQQQAIPSGEGPGQTRATEVVGTSMHPIWIDDALLLARRTTIDGEEYVQGCQLDWPALRTELLASITDLLPAATLIPAAGVPTEEERRVAAVPLTLVPGPPTATTRNGSSPLRWSMLVAWGGVGLAALAVSVALASVLALSERRRVFVSAVTHELRTPLTTFRMYTDMLANGMVLSEAKRKEYVGRLQREAERLAHLVENVLFYARVETGRASASVQPLVLGPFLERQVEALRERAHRAGLRVDYDAGPARTELTVQVDASAIEQILTNLVDNACKYAADGKLVRLRVLRSGNHVAIRVEDLGHGLSRRDRRRLFRPFSKSDRDAAQSAPGVGLGLALSRRLARAMGGDLRFDVGYDQGAAFAILLPLVT
jgi:signal transduction histidine kinase